MPKTWYLDLKDTVVTQLVDLSECHNPETHRTFCLQCFPGGARVPPYASSLPRRLSRWLKWVDLWHLTILQSWLWCHGPKLMLTKPVSIHLHLAWVFCCCLFVSFLKEITINRPLLHNSYWRVIMSCVPFVQWTNSATISFPKIIGKTLPAPNQDHQGHVLGS